MSYDYYAAEIEAKARQRREAARDRQRAAQAARTAAANEAKETYGEGGRNEPTVSRREREIRAQIEAREWLKRRELERIAASFAELEQPAEQPRAPFPF